MSNYLKPQSPMYSKENQAYFYPLTTSDQVILPDGSRLNQEGLENMITPDGIGAMSMELLWENADVTSDFGNQTLNIDLSGYSFVRIVARVAKNNPYEDSSEIGVSCSGYIRNVAVIEDSSYKFAIKCRALTVTTTGIAFDDCKEVNYRDTAAITNRYMIPYKIYGIKGVTA